MVGIFYHKAHEGHEGCLQAGKYSSCTQTRMAHGTRCYIFSRKDAKTAKVSLCSTKEISFLRNADDADFFIINEYSWLRDDLRCKGWWIMRVDLSSLRLDDVVRGAQHQGNGLRPMLSPRFDLRSEPGAVLYNPFGIDVETSCGRCYPCTTLGTGLRLSACVSFDGFAKRNQRHPTGPCGQESG